VSHTLNLMTFLVVTFNKFVSMGSSLWARYLALSGVTSSLYGHLSRHLRLFTTNGALLPRDGALLPPCPPPVGGLGVVAAPALVQAVRQIGLNRKRI